MRRSQAPLKPRPDHSQSPSINSSLPSLPSIKPTLARQQTMSTDNSFDISEPRNLAGHHTTATEKYYLQIIATMKKELSGLMQIIKAKDWEIEQLRMSKQELRVANAQMRELLGDKRPRRGAASMDFAKQAKARK